MPRGNITYKRGIFNKFHCAISKAVKECMQCIYVAFSISRIQLFLMDAGRIYHPSSSTSKFWPNTAAIVSPLNTDYWIQKSSWRMADYFPPSSFGLLFSACTRTLVIRNYSFIQANFYFSSRPFDFFLSLLFVLIFISNLKSTRRNV